MDAAVTDGSLTIMWEETLCHGGGVRHPGSRVDWTNRLAFVDMMKDGGWRTTRHAQYVSLI